MSDNNLKLKVKSELKNYMPNKLLLELFKEMDLNTSLGKNDAIDSIFQSYTAEEVKDMILKKYDEKGTYTRSKERFLKKLNRKSFEERSELKNKEEKERKRKKRQERIRKNREKKEKREQEEEEDRKLKEKEFEERRRQIEKERVEEAKRRQEQNRKIEEKKKREEERKQEIEKNRIAEQKKREEERKQEIEKIAKQKKREGKKRMKELLQNSSINLKIYHARCTDVYFIYDYIKSEVRKDYKTNNIRLSNKMNEIVKIDAKIIGYKYDNYHIKFFSEKLLDSIKLISEVYFRDKDGVVLVAVPPSEMGKDPQTKKSIELIEEWSNKGKYEIDFKVYDKSKFLIRTKDVESSKTGNRSVEKHENSIACDEEDNMPSNIGVIILDDVTTSGNTMYVCKNKLIEYGLDEEDVIPLAIARTLNPYNEIYDSLEGKYFVYDDNVEELK